MGKATTKKPPAKRSPATFIVLAVIVVIAIVGIILIPRVIGKPAHKKEVITVSNLEKIINISELSTFTAVYNGIAQVMNEKNPEKTDYYVSYEAKVNAGIDFEKIRLDVDADEKIVYIYLPQIHITQAPVDITSLDYIFINKKANTSTISEAAYKACEADVRNEGDSEYAILDLAEQNAENIVEALTRPFIEQVDPEYTLTIQWEGE